MSNKDAHHIIKELISNKSIPTINDTKMVLDLLMPRDEKNDLISTYSIKQKRSLTAGAMFVPQYNNLQFSYEKMIEWCERQCADFINNTYVSKEKYSELYNTFWFWALLHEIEHSKQFAIALKNYPCECNNIPLVYNELFELMLKDNSSWYSLIPFYDLIRIIRKIIYKRNENNLLLERNANIFSFEEMLKIVETNPEISEEILQLFNHLYIANLLLGYEKTDNKMDYPISQTLKTIGKRRKINQLDFSCNIPLIMQMSYGMPMDENIIEDIIHYYKENSHDPIKVKKKVYEILK